jgi:hypothetical protein
MVAMMDSKHWCVSSGVKHFGVSLIAVALMVSGPLCWRDDLPDGDAVGWLKRNRQTVHIGRITQEYERRFMLLVVFA